MCYHIRDRKAMPSLNYTFLSTLSWSIAVNLSGSKIACQSELVEDWRDGGLITMLRHTQYATLPLKLTAMFPWRELFNTKSPRLAPGAYIKGILI